MTFRHRQTTAAGSDVLMALDWETLGRWVAARTAAASASDLNRERPFGDGADDRDRTVLEPAVRA